MITSRIIILKKLSKILLIMNNQLFYKIPEKELVSKILSYFIPDIFDTNFYFTRKDIEDKNILEDMKEDLDVLSNYYLPCKRKIYFTNVNSKKIITILRQILKNHNYKINSVEKYSKGKKFLLYNLDLIEDNTENDNKNYDLTVNFD